MSREDEGTTTLVRRAMDGDQASLSKLQDAYAPGLCRFLEQYCDEDDSLERIADKAWSEIQKGFAGYDPGRCGFPSFIENRARFALLKFWCAPEFRGSRSLDRLTAELRDHPSPFESDEEFEELDLVIRAQCGDSDAFNQLWAANQEPIYGYIRWQIRGSDADQIAKDVLGGLCLFLRQKISIYDPNRSRFRTFAKLYADSLRKRYFRQGREILFAWIQNSASSDTESGFRDVPDPQESIEQRLIKYETAKKLLYVTFNLPSPPHQLVVFGFNRLLEWRPAEIVREFSDRLLKDLERKLETDFVEGMTYDERFIRDCFQTLRGNMDLILGSVVRHPKARESHKDLLDRKIGTLMLECFYTKPADREDNVVKWSGNVWKSIRLKMLETEFG